MMHFDTKRGLRALAFAGVAMAAPLTSLPALAQGSDTLVIARSMDVNSLDPQRAFCDTCQFYLTAVYETLVTLAPDNKSLVPNLAERWEVNDDFTEFTFHLKDATFADGSPVEASDVVWSFERLKNLKGSPSFLMDGLVGAEAVDAKTVKVTLEAPNGEFLNKVSAPYGGIVNAEVAMANGAIAGEEAATEDKAEPWFLANSAGSGPYMLKAYSPEAELRLGRNDAYHGEAPGFSEIVVTQISDAVSQAQALETGQVDIAMQIDPDTASSIRSDDVTTEVVPSYNFLYVGFIPGAKGMKDVLTPEVRTALALAIDYEGVLDFTVGGAGARQAAPIPNGFPGTAGLTPRERDLEKAKEMLAAAGAEDLKLVAGYPNDNIYGVDFNIMMQKVQQDFAEAGVELELKPLTWSVWRDELGAGEWGVTAIYYAPDYYGSGQYVSYFGMMEGFPWANRAGVGDSALVRNETEEKLYAQALAASGEEADAIYAKIAEEMMKEAIILPLVSPNLVLAYRSDIEGVRYSACCNLPLAEISRK
ncbi:ABC transporter substrate-binding protein [Albimonas pacifica]|uniref:Peptide/nickel transport system substrate-binding protein n=1 Tax=Albimonas pacifica TaxID=1114924 RepID=A0A1I3BR52_9RHOB|nr:ABC transporter substrate-binding protein [Albimonas pacifica]SFH64752.1 peptide/nickel transport system substrate-binding protein [Albimonas pacifica]